MELERSKAADASAAVFTRVLVFGCGALEERVVRDGAGTADEDATARFELRCLSEGSRSSLSIASICVRARAIVAVSSSCGGPLPNMADFFRRKAEFQRFFTAFSALPGSNLAIFVQALPQRCCASASMVSSSCVQPPFFRFGSRWFVQRSRHCLPILPGILSAICIQVRPPSFMHAIMILSSSSVKAPFTRPALSTFCHRCKHCTSLRPWPARCCSAILFQS
mmetsp:Transcript_5531/g.16754  ORF Transcript_5531/g.16754 Transcript_5531/m.16754 type:complete len:223 (-) Transcript_5531:789-1457(-)